MKLYYSPLLIANIVKVAVSGLRQFVASGSSCLFGHVEKTVWSEREG